LRKRGRDPELARTRKRRRWARRGDGDGERLGRRDTANEDTKKTRTSDGSADSVHRQNATALSHLTLDPKIGRHSFSAIS